jgi:hypothetical protein
MSTQTATWRNPTARLRENPERLAWAVLLACFGIFLLLAVTVPLATLYSIRYATVAQTARLEPTQGTIFLYARARDDEPIAVTALKEHIEEGARLVAMDEATQATFSLNSEPDTGETLGSVQLYAGTDITLVRLRRPLFQRSTEPFRSVLQIDNGQARVFTSPGGTRGIAVELRTPHGGIVLEPGSYQVSVAEDATEITVRSGVATLAHDDGAALDVQPGQRAWMTAGSPPEVAASPEQNLISNGTFTPPALDDWPSYTVAEANTTPGKVQFSAGEEGRQVALFIRMGEEKLHTEVGIQQQLDRAVNVYDDLRIQLDTKILFQSLPGAGSLNSEFPLRVEIAYRDIYGKDLTWGHGFYYREADEGEAYPRVVNGTRVRQGQWFTYVSPNLIELLDTEGTRPAYIQSIRFYASGHNYQSMVSEVYLLAE